MIENITEDEAALYDRQIRLWGLDAQKRLRAARVLLIGVSGLGAEVAKNIVLSGIKSITLLDSVEMSLEDTCSLFLVDKALVGTNRAKSSVERTQQLNPMVEVKFDVESSELKPAEYFESFDVVCATCCRPTELLRLDEICQQRNIAFFAGDVFGFYGFMFANLHEHEYAEDVVSHVKAESHVTDVDETAEPAAKKPHIEEQHSKTVKKVSKFSNLLSALSVDWSTESNSTKLKKTPQTYFIVRVLLEFRSRQGRDPKHTEDDLDKLKITATELLKSVGVSEDFIPQDFYNYCIAAVSPVCAITGGILAQEIIKAVSLKDAPHNNFFFYNGVDGSGLVDRIG